MIIGSRIQERINAVGKSQAWLGRQVGLNQSTINGLVRGGQTSTTKIVEIARALRTSPDYLTGEIDDPSEGAPPPPPEPRIQLVSLPVALPSVSALAAAFEGVLLASPRMGRAELAHELAKRLPTVLRIAGDALPIVASAQDDDDFELPGAPAIDRPVPQRA